MGGERDTTAESVVIRRGFGSAITATDRMISTQAAWGRDRFGQIGKCFIEIKSTDCKISFKKNIFDSVCGLRKTLPRPMGVLSLPGLRGEGKNATPRSTPPESGPGRGEFPPQRGRNRPARGNAPGKRSRPPSRALKGRYKPGRGDPPVPPFQGSFVKVARFPGRCPGLICLAPFGANPGGVRREVSFFPPESHRLSGTGEPCAQPLC